MPEDRPAIDGATQVSPKDELSGQEREGASVVKIVTLRTELTAEEEGLKRDIQAVGKAFEGWALPQIGTRIGQFEGTFAGQDADGQQCERTVRVSTGMGKNGVCLYECFSIKSGADGKMGIKILANPYSEQGIELGKVTQRTDSKTWKPMDVMVEDLSRRFVHISNKGVLDFDEATQRSEEIPDFVGKAQEELALLKTTAGTFQPLSAIYH